MHFHPAVVALGLILSSTLAAPLPQLAGEGAACNSILSQTDNGIGYGVQNAEDNTANFISSLHLPGRRRQLAGEGAACDSILSQTDNGIGYGVQNAEENTARLIAGGKNTGTGNGSGSVKKPGMGLGMGMRRRQLDKVVNGAQAISQALGTGAVTTPITQAADTLDGVSTGGAADLGAKIGDAEAETLEGIGAAVLRREKRQLDKISNGFQNVATAAKVGDLTRPLTNGLNGIDGTTTSAGAQLGAEIGDIEAGTLEAVGNRVP